MPRTVVGCDEVEQVPVEVEGQVDEGSVSDAFFEGGLEGGGVTMLGSGMESPRRIVLGCLFVRWWGERGSGGGECEVELSHPTSYIVSNSNLKLWI